MIRRFGVPLGTALCGLVLSACGHLTQSPAHDLTFQAPPGFVSRTSIMGMMQLWTADGGKQHIMLFRMPAGVDSQSAIKSANFKNAQVLKQESITICKGEPATFVTLLDDNAKTAARSAHHDMVQMVILNTKANTLFSMYAYPQGTAPNPAAESVLRKLCTKPSSTV